MNHLESTLEQIRQEIEAANSAREHALTLSREVVRFSANAIRATHRQDFAQAKALQQEAHSRLMQIRQALVGFPAIYWTGYVQDAQKEFAEACLTLAFVCDEAIPTPCELHVENAAYLNALGEAAGELRRYFLDLLRQGKVERAERVLCLMDDIYDGLAIFDYPEALTSGLRRTCDMLRGVLERSRGDLTAAIRQERLQEALRRVEEQTGG